LSPLITYIFAINSIGNILGRYMGVNKQFFT